MRRTVLYLDVDGVLNPAPPRLRPHGSDTWRDWKEYEVTAGAEGTFAVWLSASIGRALEALACDIVWATTWLHHAPEHIGPKVGISSTDVLAWQPIEAPRVSGEEHCPTFGWIRAISERILRPVVWIDDEITAADHAWATGRGEALVIAPDPIIGITAPDIERVRHFIAD